MIKILTSFLILGNLFAFANDPEVTGVCRLTLPESSLVKNVGEETFSYRSNVDAFMEQAGSRGMLVADSPNFPRGNQLQDAFVWIVLLSTNPSSACDEALELARKFKLKVTKSENLSRPLFVGNKIVGSNGKSGFICVGDIRATKDPFGGLERITERTSELMRLSSADLLEVIGKEFKCTAPTGNFTDVRFASFFTDRPSCGKSYAYTPECEVYIHILHRGSN